MSVRRENWKKRLRTQKLKIILDKGYGISESALLKMLVGNFLSLSLSLRVKIFLSMGLHPSSLVCDGNASMRQRWSHYDKMREMRLKGKWNWSRNGFYI